MHQRGKWKALSLLFILLIESNATIMYGQLAIFIFLSVSIFACKSNKDVAAEAALASENSGPALDTTSASAPPTDPQNTTDQSEVNQPTMDDGGTGFMVQLESVMGTPSKSKYKGIKDLSFEKGYDGYTRIFLGKELGRAAAEQLRDEYKLRGFEGAFVVGKGAGGGSGASSGSVMDASSSTSLDNVQGLVYLIQLSAFQVPAETKAPTKLGWYQILEFDDGWKRVYSGAYSSLLSAQDALKKYRRKGFKDCYVVPFDGYTNKLNGKTGKVSATSQQ